MQQYFVNGPAETPVTIRDADTVKHMFSVMRLADADEVILVFDDGIKYLARVLDTNQHSFELIETLDADVELPIQVTIAMGFPKGDKLDMISQKATELGASAIWAFPAAWSVVKWDSKKLAKRQDKLQKIAQGAAEQSKRNKIPDIALLASHRALEERFTQFDKILIAYEESAKAGEHGRLVQTLKNMAPGQRLLIIFGPEGGLSPDEVDNFVKLGGQVAGLGPRIMRTETAPLYALASVSFYFELLK